MKWAIGVGSNAGDRVQAIAAAAALVDADADIQILTHAALLENPAQDVPAHVHAANAAYMNTVWIIETKLGAHQVLYRLQRIEQALGRVRTLYHGARRIDLDILLCEDARIIASSVLSVPHPSMHLRDFVLEPLQSVAGEWLHPHEQCSVAVLCDRLRYSL